MIRRVNLALMEAENVRRCALHNERPLLHPLAEYYGKWECAQREKPVSSENSKTIKLKGDYE